MSEPFPLNGDTSILLDCPALFHATETTGHEEDPPMPRRFVGGASAAQYAPEHYCVDSRAVNCGSRTIAVSPGSATLLRRYIVRYNFTT